MPTHHRRRGRGRSPSRAGKRPRTASGSGVPGDPGEPDDERQDQEEQDERREVALERGREPEPGEETQHHAGQRGHDLDRRLDVGEESGVHELRGVHRAEHAQRDGEEQRIERPLERADDERRQAELGLEVVGAAGRLPDVLGLLVALVEDLAEQRLPGDLGVGVVDLHEGELARAGDEGAVALGREGQGGRPGDRRAPLPERALRGREVDSELAAGVLGEEGAVALRRRDQADGRGVAGEVVDAGEDEALLARGRTGNQTLRLPFAWPTTSERSPMSRERAVISNAPGGGDLGREVVALVELPPVEVAAGGAAVEIAADRGRSAAG